MTVSSIVFYLVILLVTYIEVLGWWKLLLLILMVHGPPCTFIQGKLLAGLFEVLVDSEVDSCFSCTLLFRDIGGES